MPDRIERISLDASLAIVLMAIAVAFVSSQAATAPSQNPAIHAAAPMNWQSTARWRHGVKKTAGTLALTHAGVEFRPAQGPTLRWTYVEIQTFDLSPHCLTVTGYENRGWRLPGERTFRFDLASVVPPAVAAELAERLAKPAENGVPNSDAPAFATLRARHRTRDGGTNGVLRFGESGIDYVTPSGRGARSWRWADIQTLAYPDAFHFRVGAYREIFEFELKEPMSVELFEQIWNDVYARDLSGVDLKGVTRP